MSAEGIWHLTTNTPPAANSAGERTAAPARGQGAAR